jgi:EAL domain-containing protein (putative c-di-GMP-specific phosphodiesterase class I)
MGCETVQGFVFGEPMFEQDYRMWVSHAGGGKTEQSVA